MPRWHKTPQVTPFWKVNTPSYLLRGMVSILQISLFVTKFWNLKKENKCSFISGFLCKLCISEEKRCSTCSLLLGKCCLCGLKGRGATQLFVLSLTSTCSIISKKSLSSIDIATRLSSLVLWKAVHPKIHSAASPEYGDTTCVRLFGSLAAYGTPKSKHRLQAF